MKKPVDNTYHPPSPNYYSGRGRIVATRANLPHWNKAMTASFVTFRLADALPQEKLLKLENERTSWLAAHPQPWDVETAKEYFTTFDETVQGWLDAGLGSCVLADAACRQIVEDALWHFAGERYALYAYVIMPNHVHVLFMPVEGWTLSQTVANWKSFSGHEINRLTGSKGTLWQKESFDTLVRSERHFQTIVRYIKKNDLMRAWSAIG